MDFDDLIEPNFDETSLFRTICELTQSLENMEELGEPAVQEPNLGGPAECAGASPNIPPPRAAIAGLEPVDSTLQQKEDPHDLPTQNVLKNADKNTASIQEYSTCYQSRDQLDLEIQGSKGLIASLTAQTKGAGSSKEGESSKRKRSVRQPPSDSATKSSDGGVPRYNLRRRTGTLNYSERGARATGLLQLEAPPRAGSRSKKSAGETRKETGGKGSTKLRFSVSRFTAQVDTKCDWVEGGASSSSSSGERSAGIPNGQEHGSRSIKTSCKRKIVSAKMDFDGHSVTLCRKSESSFFSRVSSRSTKLKARQWKQNDRERFFLIFSAMAAEAHTVKSLKTRRIEACRRWLSCMRNILSTAPF